MMMMIKESPGKPKTRVKICGITRSEDAFKAAELGADAVGFIFAESPRKVTPEAARQIIELLPPWVSRVGVFVDEDIRLVREILDYCSLDYLQFHGHETPEYCRKFPRRGIKAFRIQKESDLASLADYSLPVYLLDTFTVDRMGGTGQTFDWRLAISAKRYGRIILSGGLNPVNVAQAIQFVRPWGVDASSGLEICPGQKDHSKLSSFFNAVSSASSTEETEPSSSPITKG
ncbi:MAG: phosphoribosylanthranilate isomerase [bacterium]